jgi:hypothetical protein
MPRLKILSASEQNEYDSPPILYGDIRKAYFRLNKMVYEMIKRHRQVNYGSSGRELFAIIILNLTLTFIYVYST